MTLGERMLQYRAKERISQEELARRCGLSLQTVNHIELGYQSASRLTLAKIEQVLAKGENGNVEDGIE